MTQPSRGGHHEDVQSFKEAVISLVLDAAYLAIVLLLLAGFAWLEQHVEFSPRLKTYVSWLHELSVVAAITVFVFRSLLRIVIGANNYAKRMWGSKR
jgi:hypothetical protein